MDERNRDRFAWEFEEFKRKVLAGEFDDKIKRHFEEKERLAKETIESATRTYRPTTPDALIEAATIDKEIDELTKNNTQPTLEMTDEETDKILARIRDAVVGKMRRDKEDLRLPKDIREIKTIVEMRDAFLADNTNFEDYLEHDGH